MRIGKTVAAVLTLAVMMTLTIAPAGSAPALTEHRPNLRTRKPTSLTIRVESGRKLLRFSNVVANVGDGPLEVEPVNNPDTGTTDAYQDVYTHDLAGNWVLLYQRFAGTFVFHPEHDHWHFEDFSEYALHRVTSSGGVGEVVSGQQDKVSFCITDSQHANANLEHFSDVPAYPSSNCDQNATQGLSVGWADRYGWRLPGQYVDVTGIANGKYWLVSTADPVDRLVETNETDNTYALKIKISSDAVTVL